MISMDIVLRTGFQAITHSISFNKETENKGKALAVCHVMRVEEVRKKDLSTIRCSVIRQTSVSLTPYKVKLQLNHDRHVTAVSCTCVSQAAGKCKHVNALIHFINSDRSATKTSVEQEWGKPTDSQLGKELYAKGIVVSEKFTCKATQNKVQVPPFPLQLSDLAFQPCALRSYLLEANRTEAERIVKTILNNHFHDMFDQIAKAHCEKCILEFISLSNMKKIYTAQAAPDDTLLNFYNQEVFVEAAAVVELCIKTRDQAGSKDWFLAREKRISASSKAHNIKVRKTKTVESLLKEFFNQSKLKGKAKQAIEYGRKNESNAISQYEQSYAVTVATVGLIVAYQQPWLCASPDGVVIKNEQITKLLEIKCPSSCEKLPIVDSTLGKSNVSYLTVKNDVIELKRSHQYYTQVQVQMYVTGVPICDLYVWSPKGSCLVTVHRNEAFLEDLIPLLERFYFTEYLKALYDRQKENEAPVEHSD